MKILTLLLFVFWIPLASFGLTSNEPTIVSLAGIDIFQVKQSIGSFSANDRAQAIQKRIENLSENKLFDVSSISVEEREHSSEILAGDQSIVSITDQDAAAEDKTRPSMAAEIAEHIRQAIHDDRTTKSPQELLTSLIYAGLTTLLLLLILFFVSRTFPKIYAWINGSKGTRFKSLRIRSLEILSEDRIIRVLLWFARASRLILTLLVFYIYLPLVLSYFPWTANLAPKLFGFILNPIEKVAHAIYSFLPNVFFIFIAIIATNYILRFIRLFFDEIANGSLQFEGFHKEWALPTYKLVRVLVIAFSLVVIFPYLPGSGSPAFQGVSVFLGILLSVGSSSSIGNIVSGIVLTYMRPFAIGDRVQIADSVGDVIERNLLVTRIRTIKNVDVTIPNGMILSSHMINYSSSAKSVGLILHTTVTIGYDVPWKQVHDLLTEAASKTEHLLKEPKPFVLQTSLDDFYVSYELNAYTKMPNSMAAIYSSLNSNIQNSFNSAGVEIMSPHYSNLRDGNETTIPSDNRPNSYVTPTFKIESNRNIT